MRIKGKRLLNYAFINMINTVNVDKTFQGKGLKSKFSRCFGKFSIFFFKYFADFFYQICNFQGKV